MINLSDLIGEFDKKNRIVHLTAKRPIHVTTLEQGKALSKAVNEILAGHLGGERGYLVTDYSKIIIEPEKIEEYASAMRYIFDTFLYPEGFARYGFEITRVTARLSHTMHLGGSPNIFNTKEEAFQYIYSLIEQRQRAESAAGDVVPRQTTPAQTGR